MCLEKAESISDLPKVLNAHKTIRKPRLEWMEKRGRENAQIYHLPDGPQQEQRDQFLGRVPLASATEWDGKHIDGPPEGQFKPLEFAYMSGFDIMDHVSIAVQKPPVATADPNHCRRREGFRTSWVEE